ncbi:MAG: hypothetical protein QMD96_02980 [Anaerosomatales bacterium]|nr:hypothetical protein [Anaerosomatales bacterium]
MGDDDLPIVVLDHDDESANWIKARWDEGTDIEVVARALLVDGFTPDRLMELFVFRCNPDKAELVAEAMQRLAREREARRRAADDGS